MSTRLVSLISSHLLPNYLFIREMEGMYDGLLFVTTEKMQNDGIGIRLEKALGLKENSVQRITVSEEDLNEMLAAMKSVSFSETDRFIVNLTCGTKIMSIGVYTHFSGYASSFYYIPIGKNKIEDVGTSEDIPLHYRVNLKEYLTLYGLTYEYDNKYVYPPEHTTNLFKRFKDARFNRYKIPEILNAHTFNEHDKRYYSGVWFEEYVYLRVKTEKNIPDDSIARGVKIYRRDSAGYNDNEIDIMYVFDNNLYIGECKVSMIGAQGNGGVKLLEQYMYKLAAIAKDFGLMVNPYIFTLHPFNRVSPSKMQAIKKRMKILGIRNILETEAFRQSRLNF
jgi:hypothetical protein